VFKVPEEEIESSTSDEKGWLGKIKDSIYQNWQTILVALIVLIVGISAYNYNENTGTNSTETANQEEAADTEGETTEEANAGEETESPEESVEAEDQVVAEQEQTQETTTQTTEETAQQTEETKIEETNTNTTNAVENIDEGYKVVAVKGEGITHLTRKALNQYLSENNDSELTASHKVYIEDYLQNRIGSQGIEIGHAEDISKASIEEAIAASKGLSQSSLDNLKKYTLE